MKLLSQSKLWRTRWSYCARELSKVIGVVAKIVARKERVTTHGRVVRKEKVAWIQQDWTGIISLKKWTGKETRVGGMTIVGGTNKSGATERAGGKEMRRLGGSMATMTAPRNDLAGRVLGETLLSRVEVGATMAKKELAREKRHGAKKTVGEISPTRQKIKAARVAGEKKNLETVKAKVVRTVGKRMKVARVVRTVGKRMNTETVKVAKVKTLGTTKAVGQMLGEMKIRATGARDAKMEKMLGEMKIRATRAREAKIGVTTKCGIEVAKAAKIIGGKGSQRLEESLVKTVGEMMTEVKPVRGVKKSQQIVLEKAVERMIARALREGTLKKSRETVLEKAVERMIARALGEGTRGKATGGMSAELTRGPSE